MASSSTPLLTCLADYADYYGHHAPQKTAIVFGQERISYRALNKQVEVCSCALLASGVKKGDRVAMICTPRPEFWILFLACNRIGAIWVGLNPKYQLDELLYLSADCQPCMLFTLVESEGRRFEYEIRALVSATASLGEVVSVGGDTPGVKSWQEFLAHGSEASDDEYIATMRTVVRSEVALIVYTSGTTGKPKGAMISHYGLCFGALMQMKHFKVDAPSLVINFPINHIACIADNAATTLVHGGKIIFQEQFNPGAVLEAMEKERCTIWGGVPTMIQMVMDHPGFDKTDFSSVEIVIWGGAALPAALIEKLRHIVPRLMAVYGMTETSANVTFTDDYADKTILAGTIGKPDRNCDCRIVGKDGKPVKEGGQGELQFNAEFLMKGYWERPQATLDTFTEEGWLKTGDVGMWMDDGNIKIVGRLTEMYKSGGYNIYPREIEMAIEEIPGVAMAAVIAIPDEIFQEVGCAYVQLCPGQTISSGDLHRACNKKLANYKVPKAFVVRKALPRLPVGKVDKQALKQIHTDSLGES